MILFIKLFLAHIIADFILQPNAWVTHKEQQKGKSIFLVWHILIHFVLYALFIFKLDFLIYAAIIALLHGIIDFVKLKFQKKKTKRNWFIIDQFIHLALLFCVVFFYTNLPLNVFKLNQTAWVLITAFIFLTQPTSIIIKNIISVWTPKEKEKKDQSLQNAGNYIGILERIFVVTFILLNEFEAIGFLLAAKSIFRFSDLKKVKDRKLTEYVLIGTLLSFGIAILVGLIALQFQFI